MFFLIDTPARPSLFSIKSEPAPAFGLGRLDAKQDALFCLLAHLFPLVIYFWKRGDSPAVAAHGKEALNFALSLVLCIVPVSIVCSLLGTVMALIASLLTTVVSLAAFGLAVYGAWQSRQGVLVRYPLNFRLIK